MSDKPNRRKQGAQGELRAEQALQKAGYRIVARNWRCSEGEIDLIAYHEGEYVFVEVRGCSVGVPAALESLSKRKIAHLQSVAQAYLHSLQQDDVPFRFDLVAIDYQSGAIEIVRDALAW